MDRELEADEALTAKTIRDFIRDGRLTTIPSREKRRRIIFRYLRDQVFTEDRGYPEAEVNQRLALFHPDVVKKAIVDSSCGAGWSTRASSRARLGRIGGGRPSVGGPSP